MALVVGISDCRVVRNPSEEIITYALGSCIAVLIHDKAAGVAGMLHFMLPDSTIDAARAAEKPFMFADTGIPLLFHQAYELGAQKRRISVQLFGGAQVMDAKAVFDIGRRNHMAARKILWRAGAMIQSENVGGTESRTVRMDAGSGAVWVRTGGRPEVPFVPAGAAKGMVHGLSCVDCR
jgi:chemotaxis protein CheD